MAAGTLELANGVAPVAPGAGLLRCYSDANKCFSNINESGFILANPVIRENEIQAIRPQVSNGLVAAPGAITNTSGLMLGCSNITAACIITPQVTGRIMVWVNGVATGINTAVCAWHIRYGTGTAPTNAAALTGTQIGGQQTATFLTGFLHTPFSQQAYVSGLTLGTAVWLDLVTLASTGAITMTQVQVNAIEL